MAEINIISRIILFLMLVVTLGCNSSKFESENWKTGTDRDRGKMASYITENKLIIDKNRKEVIELLGEPDSQDKEKCMYYDLDMGHLIEWNYVLQICFNKNNKVNYVQVND